jgi:hypothetical protein
VWRSRALVLPRVPRAKSFTWPPSIRIPSTSSAGSCPRRARSRLGAVAASLTADEPCVRVKVRARSPQPRITVTAAGGERVLRPPGTVPAHDRLESGPHRGTVGGLNDRRKGVVTGRPCITSYGRSGSGGSRPAWCRCVRYGRASDAWSQQSGRRHLDVHQPHVALVLRRTCICPLIADIEIEVEVEVEQRRRRGAPLLRSPRLGDDFYVMPINEVQHESGQDGEDDLAEVLKWCGRRIARDLWEQAAAGSPAGSASGEQANAHLGRLLTALFSRSISLP